MVRRRKPRKDWQKIIFSLVLAAIFLFSTIGLIFSSVPGGSSGDVFGNTYSEVYNGVKFESVPNANVFVAEIDEQEVFFSYLPRDVETMTVDTNVFPLLTNKPQLKITSDSLTNYSDIKSLISYDMSRLFESVDIQRGYVDENNPYGFEQITCEDATEFVPVLYLMNSNETKISVNNNCVIAQADSQFGYLRIRDRLLFGMYGIIE